MFGNISTCIVTWRLRGYNVADMIMDALVVLADEIRAGLKRYNVADMIMDALAKNPGYAVICP